MNYELLETLQRELDRLDDPTLPSADFGTIEGTVVARSGMLYEHEDELYIWDAPIMASWATDCE